MGASILASGGNAIDAAVAVAAGLALTEPCSNGLGGDMYLLYYEAASGRVHALNGSGRSGAALTLAAGQSAAPGAAQLPSHHAHTITVPGAARGWCDALKKWGNLPLSTCLAPATRLARAGFPVSPITAHAWAEGRGQLLRWREGCPAAVDQPEALLLAGCRAPRTGELFANPALADAFDVLAAEGAAGFYGGRVGRAIVEAVRSVGGVLTLEDLVAHASTWPEAISLDFCGVRVWEVPPNGQGLVALLALQTIEAVLKGEAPLSGLGEPDGGDAGGLAWTGFEDLVSHLPGLTEADRRALLRLRALGHNSASHLHLVTEALRLAFADGHAFVADSDAVPATAAAVSAMLTPAYAASRAALFDPSAASADAAAGQPRSSSDTVSFSVVDAAGNAVSWIQSNFMGFGSGLVPRGCGFSLQNRGAGFSLVAGHPNALAPSKRPYHTIIPCMLTRRDGGLLATCSCMGGFMQPQGHVQLMLNLLAFGADPQTAIDAPRMCIGDGESNGAVAMEEGIEERVVRALGAAGHRLGASGAERAGGFLRALFGRAQIILRHPATGVLWAGSDGRGDGQAVAVWSPTAVRS